MIAKKFFGLFLCLLTSPALSEIIRVNINDVGNPPPEQYNPGFYYNNTTSAANAVFDAAPYFCNCLRGNDIAYRLRTSTSHANFISWVVNLRNLFEHRAPRTSRMIIEVSGMPYWLSSSTDSTPTGSGWRYFQTVFPRDIIEWDSLIRDMALEISTWNFTPYYEFWNEPDLHDFWNGTEQELIELYIHTANVIKSVDPDAKVGGFAVNGWKKGIDTPNYTVWGYYPDSLAEITSSTAHLIDSCAANGTPLDFITWHFFSVFPKDLEFGADYYRRKLDGHGMPGTEQIITEYNCIGSLRETTKQPGIFIRFYNYIAGAGIEAHSMAALQDFSYDPTFEFFGDYGSMSRGALCKPAYYAILLIDYVQRNGNLIPVYPESSITTLASRSSSELRLLIANFVDFPLYEGYERLLWDVHHVNTIDLANAGYTRWGQVDSTIMGYYAPIGPPEVIAAFEDANQRYEWALVHYYIPRSLDIIFSGLNGMTDGTLCLIDDSHNNNIYKYDSLRAEGYTREQAVNFLYSIQGLEFNNIQVTDYMFHYNIPSNGVLLITLQDIVSVTENSDMQSAILNHWFIPNPLKSESMILMPKGLDDYRFRVYDILGRNLFECNNNDVNSHKLRLPRLSAGVYFARIETDKASKTQKLVILQ
jgi:hypothetical protein